MDGGVEAISILRTEEMSVARDINRKLRLKPWFTPYISLGKKPRDISITVTGSRYVIDSVASLPNQKLVGYYAKYREGIFVLFVSTSGAARFGWAGELFSFDDVESCSRENNFSGLKFECLMTSKSRIQFKYRTLLKAPWRLITDILMPDDDWFLTHDLPGFVEDLFNSDGESLQQVEVELASQS